jgi:hypothetical protein
MEEIAQLLLLTGKIVACAAVGEAVNEHLIAPLMDLLKGKVDDTLRQQGMRMWSAGVGILIALEFQLDAFEVIDLRSRNPVFSMVLTGLLIGRGSNWVHSFLKKHYMETRLIEEVTSSQAAASVFK